MTQPIDPSTGDGPQPGPDPGNTDPGQLVAPLQDGDDAVAQLAQLLAVDPGDDDPLGF